MSEEQRQYEADLSQARELIRKGDGAKELGMQHLGLSLRLAGWTILRLLGVDDPESEARKE